MFWVQEINKIFEILRYVEILSYFNPLFTSFSRLKPEIPDLWSYWPVIQRLYSLKETGKYCLKKHSNMQPFPVFLSFTVSEVSIEFVTVRIFCRFLYVLTIPWKCNFDSQTIFIIRRLKKSTNWSIQILWLIHVLFSFNNSKPCWN